MQPQCDDPPRIFQVRTRVTVSGRWCASQRLCEARGWRSNWMSRHSGICARALEYPIHMVCRWVRARETCVLSLWVCHHLVYSGASGARAGCVSMLAGLLWSRGRCVGRTCAAPCFVRTCRSVVLRSSLWRACGTKRALCLVVERRGGAHGGAGRTGIAIRAVQHVWLRPPPASRRLGAPRVRI